ncbi:hypothetical protein [uncultured Cohaesibacter sp.]|uniref:hypothetical protein n=1 Tax=uncultured Cohaesibacter sp. TaxID=1002546 RepID=UPI0029C73F06|nr:hypothetical protein [uncultured Cohaesibacter sp.]
MRASIGLPLLKSAPIPSHGREGFAAPVIVGMVDLNKLVVKLIYMYPVNIFYRKVATQNFFGANAAALMSNWQKINGNSQRALGAPNPVCLWKKIHA